MQNLFVPHNANAHFSVNGGTLNKKLSDLSTVYSQTPINASIGVVNGKFILNNSTDGYKLNTSLASKDIINTIKAGKSQITLPSTVVTPQITNASLAPQLQKLSAQQSVKITFSLNGKTSSPSTADIASWYDQANNTYVIQPNKVQSYIEQLGLNNNINIQIHNII